MPNKLKGDIKEEEYFQTDPETHRHNESGSGGRSADDPNEEFYSHGMEMSEMALLEDSRYLCDALEIIFLLLEGCDPTFPSDTSDGLSNEEWNKRVRDARNFLETHRSRAYRPAIKEKLENTYFKKNV